MRSSDLFEVTRNVGGSTADQYAGLQPLIRDFGATGCTKTSSEKVSSIADRRQLQATIEFASRREVVVNKITHFS